jgi:hypothetical protein
MIFRGSLRGLQVLHKCDVKECVNPHHLYLGTRDMNIQDAFARERMLRLGPDENGDFFDDHEPLSLRDLLLDEDLRDAVVDYSYLTARPKSKFIH